MILVCPELEERLGKAWSRLQRTVGDCNPGISQIELDRLCIKKIETWISGYVLLWENEDK